MMNRRDAEGAGPTRYDVHAVVKWFNPTKGFGFVRPDDGSPDAFLHISVVEQAGHSSLQEGAKLVCDLSEGRKGPQVAAIHRVEAPSPGSAPAGSGMSGGQIEGTVKFFNPEKGFGFVSPDDGSKDVFISARTLERTGLFTLEPNQRVRMTTRMGQKGPMADSLVII